MGKYGFGFDIGGSAVKAGFFSEEGQLLDRWELPVRPEEGRRKLLAGLSASVDGFLAVKGLDRADILGIGMGVPGPVDAGGTVFKCVNLGWDVFNMPGEMAALTDLRVEVENDANAAALGEMWRGGGRGRKNMVMVTLGTGIGGGVVVDGRAVRGAHGAGGEIGHITVNREEQELCGCGKRGCLEQYASAAGIVRRASALLARFRGKTLLADCAQLTSKEVFDCAKRGDALALEVVEFFGAALGEALADVACVCDPEVFVIGGGVALAGEMVLETVRRHYQKYAFHASADTEFELAELGKDAGTFGAMKLLLG